MQFGDAADSPRGQPPSRSRRGDHCRSVETTQRPHVAVIVVQVRQQHRLDAGRAKRSRRGQRLGPPQDAHPIPEKWIGEQADPVHVEKHGRVTQPSDLHRGIHRDGDIATDTATESFTVAVFTDCALRPGGISSPDRTAACN